MVRAEVFKLLDQNIQNFKTLEWKSRDRKVGRSKSNSLNPPKSQTMRNSNVYNIIIIDINHVAVYHPFLPQSLTEVQWVKEFHQFSDKNEHHSQCNNLTSHNQEARSHNNEGFTEGHSIIKSTSNPLKNSDQQSNEKTKLNQEERYEGSDGSIEQTPYYKKNFDDSLREFDKSDGHESWQIIENLEKSFLSNEDIHQNNIECEGINHATFDNTGFMNPPTVGNSKNPSHNTSVETVIKQVKLQKPLTFMGVLQDAIDTFSKTPTSQAVFEMKPKEQNYQQIQVLMSENYELREDNQTIVEENDKLKEELQHKDELIAQLSDKIKYNNINLKEWEIRLSHTTGLYTKEKEEKENAYIAFNRILSNFTQQESNSQKFLQQNLQISNTSPSVRYERHSSWGDYSTNMGRYAEEDEESYWSKELLPNRRHSNSIMNTSWINANQRTVHTNGSQLITNGGETNSTGILNNESYDFNPKEMEEMNSLQYK